MLSPRSYNIFILVLTDTMITTEAWTGFLSKHIRNIFSWENKSALFWMNKRRGQDKSIGGIIYVKKNHAINLYSIP